MSDKDRGKSKITKPRSSKQHRQPSQIRHLHIGQSHIGREPNIVTATPPPRTSHFSPPPFAQGPHINVPPSGQPPDFFATPSPRTSHFPPSPVIHGRPSPPISEPSQSGPPHTSNPETDNEFVPASSQSQNVSDENILTFYLDGLGYVMKTILLFL